MSDLPKFDRADFNRRGYISLAAYAKDILGTDYNDVDYRKADLSGLSFTDYEFTAEFADTDFTNATFDNVTFIGKSLIAQGNNSNFYHAAFTNCKFIYVSLDGANFAFSHIISVEFCRCFLCCSTFFNSDIYDTKFSVCSCMWANFSDSSWENVSFENSNLTNASTLDITTSGSFTLADTKVYGTTLTMACPVEGEFTGWKRIFSDIDKYLVKLLVPADAKRSSSTTYKCRCSKAKVLDIVNLRTNEHVTSIMNRSYIDTEYTVGEMVYPDSFDENRWNECSHGIHFFVDKENAIEYV